MVFFIMIVIGCREDLAHKINIIHFKIFVLSDRYSELE
jgi:hypothetical protein